MNFKSWIRSLYNDKLYKMNIFQQKYIGSYDIMCIFKTLLEMDGHEAYFWDNLPPRIAHIKNKVTKRVICIF